MSPVFVPEIGFCPDGTRTLPESAEVEAHGTRLLVVALAAAPDRTDLIAQWEQAEAECAPFLTYRSAGAPPNLGLTAVLLADTARVEATTIAQSAHGVSASSRRAIHTMTFAPLAPGTERVELRVSDGTRTWTLPLELAPAAPAARALDAKEDREGVVVRATALARYGNRLVVELRVEASHPVRQVAAPVHAPVFFSRDSEDVRRERLREHRRVFGLSARPIALEDDRGGRVEEEGRVFAPGWRDAATRKPSVHRCCVAFPAPDAEARSVTLIVPFVDINDLEHSVTADLREVPLDLELGPHRFHVVSADAQGSDERRVVMEVPVSSSSPRFMQPARIAGIGRGSYSWGGAPERGERIWMATEVGDPPIVTFEGAVLRVDGPWRLTLPAR